MWGEMMFDFWNLNMYKKEIAHLEEKIKVVKEMLEKEIDKLKEKSIKDEKELEEERKRNAFIQKGVENIFNYDGTQQERE